MSLEVVLQGSPVAVTSYKLRAYGATGPQAVAAADGTMSQGGITFDDPTGTLFVQGWQTLTVEESACSQPRLFTGTIYDRTERRGNYRHGPGREIDTTVNDQNGYLMLRNMGGADCVRPAETDIQRLAWLNSSPYAAGLWSDTGWVNGTGLPFPATSYKGKFATDVLSDLAGPYGQTYFLAWDPSNESVGLFFDFPDAVVNTSTLTISNVLDDVDFDSEGNPIGPCYPPMVDGELYITPEDVYSHLRYVYANGVYYANNSATAATFFPSPLISRGFEVQNDRVGNLSTAVTFANRILARDSAEAPTITCIVRLPSTHVGLIDAGQRIWVRFSHLTGFQSGAWTRVERKSIVAMDGNPEFYDVTLTLSTKGLARITGGGDPGDFPHPPAGAPSLVAYNDNSAETPSHDGTIPPASPGDLLVLFVASRVATSPLGDIADWTRVANTEDAEFLFGEAHNYAALYTRIADGGEVGPFGVGTGLASTIQNWGTAVFGGVDTNPNETGPALDTGVVTTTGPAAVVGCALMVLFDGVTSSVTPATGVTELSDFRSSGGLAPGVFAGYKTLTTAGTTHIEGTIASNSPSRTVYGGVTYWVVAAAGAEPPDPAQPVDGEVVTMDGANGTTAFPYAAGSLKVFVDNTDQTAAVTETIPECGDFTLAFTPTPTEQVVVFYQGA